MGRAMDVLTQQSCIVPSILFRFPGSVSRATRTETELFPDSDVTESQELQNDDDDDRDQFPE